MKEERINYLKDKDEDKETEVNTVNNRAEIIEVINHYKGIIQRVIQ